MKEVYLVRHGNVITDGQRRYIGDTELDLDEIGMRQAELLGKWFASKNMNACTIYTSPLTRTKKTANILAKQLSLQTVIEREGLKEIHLGDWENQLVEEIQKNQTQAYLDRGNNIASYQIPHGETFLEVQQRMVMTMNQIWNQIDKTSIVVSHAGVIRSYLCHLMKKDLNDLLDISIPYCSVSRLSKENGEIKIEMIGERPIDCLDMIEIQRLYQKYHVPERVIRHMQKVAAVLQELLNEIHYQGNQDELIKAALLHDLCRSEKNHAEKSAEVLRKEGWKEISDLVSWHHSEELEEGTQLSARELLWYADKLVQEDQRVTLQERFEASKAKCLSEEAFKHHAARYQKALCIEKKILKEKREHEINEDNRCSRTDAVS